MYNDHELCSVYPSLESSALSSLDFFFARHEFTDDITSTLVQQDLHNVIQWTSRSPSEQLIEAGGNVRHEAHNSWTPLHCAAAAGDAHCCAILVDAGADTDAEVRKHTTIMAIRCDTPGNAYPVRM